MNPGPLGHRTRNKQEHKRCRILQSCAIEMRLQAKRCSQPMAGSWIHGYAAPKIREIVLLSVCAGWCPVLEHRPKESCYPAQVIFLLWLGDSETVWLRYTQTHLWHLWQAPGPHQAWSDYITKINVVFGCFTQQSGRHLFPAVEGGDMFSMWKFSKLTEFHSHQSSHTAQQMIQSLQRDFICADSNPLT